MTFLALYGTLRRGEPAFRRLGLGACLRFAGPCVIPGALYDLGDYPALLAEAGEVTGELYKVVDASVMQGLDAFEGVVPRRPAASLYLREQIRLLTPRVTAWVYVYNLAADRDKLDRSRRIQSGDWKKR